jgi:cyclic pyranopterin phosphate synthase
MVVKRGTNDDQIVPLARHVRDHYGPGVVLRFIEYMDVGATNGWRMDEVLPSADVVRRLSAAFPLEPMAASAPGETAQRWRYADGGGEVGVISSVTKAFCGDCNRARLSTEGKLFLCLFASRGHDLRALLRGRAPNGAPWSDDADRRRHRPDLGRARRPLLRTARRAGARSRPRRTPRGNALHRRLMNGA